MLRTFLLLAAIVAVFIATVSWLYLIIAFALWMLVFGDDSTTFGYYALAIAVPLALIVTGGLLGAAIRRSASTNILWAAIITSVVLELLFIVAIRS